MTTRKRGSRCARAARASRVRGSGLAPSYRQASQRGQDCDNSESARAERCSGRVFQVGMRKERLRTVSQGDGSGCVCRAIQPWYASSSAWRAAASACSTSRWISVMKRVCTISGMQATPSARTRRMKLRADETSDMRQGLPSVVLFIIALRWIECKPGGRKKPPHPDGHRGRVRYSITRLGQASTAATAPSMASRRTSSTRPASQAAAMAGSMGSWASRGMECFIATSMVLPSPKG